MQSIIETNGEALRRQAGLPLTFPDFFSHGHP
jgi:hypothetical protein